MNPGAYAFTVMPCFPYSIACKSSGNAKEVQPIAQWYIPALCVNPRTANFEAEYIGRSRTAVHVMLTSTTYEISRLGCVLPCFPVIELAATIRPPRP